MAAKEDEYENVRLFAQQSRITRLLYTLRDMNEFGLVVDFNRLQLVGESGEDHCGKITQRKFVNMDGTKTHCSTKRLLQLGIPMELNLRAIITAPPRYEAQQTYQTYKTMNTYASHHSVSKPSYDSAAHGTGANGINSALPSRQASPGIPSRPESPPPSSTHGAAQDAAANIVGLPMLSSLQAYTKHPSHTYESQRSQPQSGVGPAHDQGGLHPHSQSRDAEPQQHSQGATHASADPCSVDVDPTSGALRPIGGHAPPRPPPTNTQRMRNMLTDTHDTQDDENPDATESPKHDEHDNSGDKATSLNAASSEEISPHPAETEDMAPARGRHMHVPNSQGRPGSPRHRANDKQVPTISEIRAASMRRSTSGQAPALSSNSASNNAGAGMPHPQKAPFNPYSFRNASQPTSQQPSYTAPAPASPLHSHLTSPPGSPTEGHDIPDDVRRLFSKLPEEEMGFVAELGMLRSICHPHLVQYLGCGISSEKQADGTVPKRYLAIEWCEGGSLDTLLATAAAQQRGLRLYSYHDAWRWVLQAAKGLQHLHESCPQVVHRDLKPANLLLTCHGRAGEVKVADFGLTSLYSHASNVWRDSSPDHRFVPCHRACSLMYLAPEVVLGQECTEKVDIFSLSVVMYELFMMTPLIYLVSRSGSDEELLSYAHCVSMGHREELKTTWPEAIQDIIEMCWSGLPAERPSARELVQILQCVEGEVRDMDANCPRGVIPATGKPYRKSKGCTIS